MTGGPPGGTGIAVGLWLCAAGLLLLPWRRVDGAPPPRHRRWRRSTWWRRGRRPAADADRAGRVLVGTGAADTAARAGPVPATELADLPAVLDLAAAGLRAGAPPGPALLAAAAAAGPALHARLREVGGLLALGVEAEQAWSGAAEVPGLATVAVLAARSGSSGVRLADVLAATAATLRDDAEAAGRRAAARVGVWSVLPLGLCFLPAFVCLGIVPAVVGLAGGVTGP